MYVLIYIRIQKYTLDWADLNKPFPMDIRFDPEIPICMCMYYSIHTCVYTVMYTVLHTQYVRVCIKIYVCNRGTSSLTQLVCLWAS